MKTLLEVCRENPGRFKLFLLDIDGTALRGNEAVPGTADFICFLRKNGIPFRFFTNNSSQNRESLARRLTDGIGVEILQEELYSCADPLPDYFRKESKKSGRELRFFLLGNQEEIPGVVTFEKDCKNLMFCDGILQKDSLFVWRDIMPAQINYFRRFPDRPYVVANPDRLYPVENGNLNICSGGCAKFVCDMLKECGIRKDCVFMGKPYAPIYEGIKQVFGDIEPEKIAGVGDFLYSDICGANRNGITSVLVLSGLTDEAAAESAQGELKPDLICKSLG